MSAAALVRLRTLGLVQWVRRLRRDSGTGWRYEQASNAYTLHPRTAAIPTESCDSEKPRAVQKKEFGFEAERVVVVIDAVANRVLAAVRARREAVLGGWRRAPDNRRSRVRDHAR